MMDLANIWNGIYKPEKYRNKDLSDFFELDFTLLPHKLFEEVEFKNQANALRERFNLDHSHPSSVFLPKTGDMEANLPVDGLGIFFNQTWDVIRN